MFRIFDDEARRDIRDAVATLGMNARFYGEPFKGGRRARLAAHRASRARVLCTDYDAADDPRSALGK